VKIVAKVVSYEWAVDVAAADVAAVHVAAVEIQRAKVKKLEVAASHDSQCCSAFAGI